MEGSGVVRWVVVALVVVALLNEAKMLRILEANDKYI